MNWCIFSVWVFSRIIEKELFDAFFNSILAILVILTFDKKRVYFLITVIFVISNFYLLVLFFTVERLKFGMIFFLLSLYYYDRIKLFSFFGFISVISHIQLAILLCRYSVKLGS